MPSAYLLVFGARVLSKSALNSRLTCNHGPLTWRRQFTRSPSFRKLPVIGSASARVTPLGPVGSLQGVGHILRKIPPSSHLFHTSPRRNINPLIWFVAKPIAKVATMITGRQFRKWWKVLTPDEKKYYYQKFAWKILAGVGLLGFAGVVNYYAHLQEAPITKRKRYIAFTESQFMKICKFELQMHLEEAESHIIPFDDPRYKRIQRVTQSIINSNQDIEMLKKQVWKIVVVQSKEANAFVLPTGHIFVYTGLLDIARNDDMLAVVIGHEMAHAILGHGAEQVSFAQLVDVVVIAVMAGIWVFMPNDGIALVTQWFYNKVTKIMLHLPHSRKMESEADQVGLMLMAKACYDVRESSCFWKLMQLKAEVDSNSEGELPDWLCTHPANATRADELDSLMPQAIEAREACKCPKLPSKDPKETMALLKSIVYEMIEEKEQKAKAEEQKHEEAPRRKLPISVPVITPALTTNIKAG